MSWFGSFINSEAGSQTIGSLVGLGTGLIVNNQVKQDAKAEANNAQALADKQLQAQQLDVTNGTITITKLNKAVEVLQKTTQLFMLVLE